MQLLPNLYISCSKEDDQTFRRYVQTTDKQYTFKPHEHENCDQCIESEDGYTQCTMLPEEDILNLEYGITVIKSSDPDDAEYTLAGATENGEYNDPVSLRRVVNWNNENNTFARVDSVRESFINGEKWNTIDYWEFKTMHRLHEFISEISEKDYNILKIMLSLLQTNMLQYYGLK